MNEKMIIFAAGMLLGAMFKGLLMLGIVLIIIGSIGYVYVKRTRLMKWAKALKA